MYVSHLLKWKTIETLIERRYENYDLGGMKAKTPNFNWQPTKSQYGISDFKDGWARGRERRIFIAEKFLTENSLDFYLNYYKKNLSRYFFTNSLEV